MSLDIALTQHVECAAVVEIAKSACETILRVYNSEVGLRSTEPAPGLEMQCSMTCTFDHGEPPIARWSLAHCRPPLQPLPPPPPPSPMPSRPRQAESWNVERKSDDSPLTRADKEANAVICDGLARIGA